MGATASLKSVFAAVLLIAFSTACRSPVARSSTPSVEARNNAASLLYDLLGDESNVSKLLIIKRDRDELHRVIKRIAVGAQADRKALDRLAKQDPTLDLKNTALPAGEKAARASESKARTEELLHASGAAFEFALLLTQTEALGYAEHLAKVAAQNEPQPERASAFAEISGHLKQLHGEVLVLLRTGQANSAK